MELQPEVLTVVPVLDTSQYAIGDVLFNPIEIGTNIARYPEGKVYLVSIQVLDEDDQGQPFDLHFLDAATNLGTINVAPNISDTGARGFLAGPIKVGSGDYFDMGGCRVANPEFAVRLLKSAAGSQSFFVAGISQGTGTYTASGLKLKIGLSY